MIMCQLVLSCAIQTHTQNTHTLTHTLTQTNTRTHIQLHTYVYTHTHKYVYTHIMVPKKKTAKAGSVHVLYVTFPEKKIEKPNVGFLILLW
jgi:hypothetical protein